MYNFIKFFKGDVMKKFLEEISSKPASRRPLLVR